MALRMFSDKLNPAALLAAKFTILKFCPAALAGSPALERVALCDHLGSASLSVHDFSNKVRVPLFQVIKNLLILPVLIPEHTNPCVKRVVPSWIRISPVMADVQITAKPAADKPVAAASAP